MKALLLLFALATTQMYSQGYICAIGGGSENYNDWSNKPYSWIVQKADSGKVIIIDVANATSWLPNYFMSLGADTAYNKTISSKTIANLTSTYDELISAKAIFIRGGDQWDYIRTWKETKVDSAIQYVFKNGGVIAGTSAGASVLGEVDFSASAGTVYPEDAIQFPFNNKMKFENNFLKLQNDVLFDTHFIERGRLPRLIAMIYNWHIMSRENIIGVGIDDRTAICISPNGVGEVMGSGAVTILQIDEQTKLSNYNSSDLYTVENLKADLLTDGWRFDFIDKKIDFIPSSAKNIDFNARKIMPSANFVLTGNDNINEQYRNIEYFLSKADVSNILLITHSGFLNINLLISHLQLKGINYSVLNLSKNNLNEKSEAQKISTATSFIVWGDSLEVLSLLNQKGNSVADEFYKTLDSKKSFLLIGNTGKISSEKYIDNTDEDYLASYRGKMLVKNGVSFFDELIFQPKVYEDDDFKENRVSAVFWGLMRNRKSIGILADRDSRMEFSSDKNSVKFESSIPPIIIDCRNTDKIDSSTYRAKSSIGTRQIAAMNNVRISLSKYDDISYLFDQQQFDFINFQEENDNSSTDEMGFQLLQNYPNPFNPTTMIEFVIPHSIISQFRIPTHATLKVYDMLGREIVTLINKTLTAGNYKILFDGNKLSSGIYFYQLRFGNYFRTNKMMLMK